MADDTRYAYAVARIRGMETKLLDRQWIERLLSETAEGALKALGDSAYQEAFADVEDPGDIEAGLERALATTLEAVAEVAPEPELIDCFRLRADAANLKALLKASLLQREDEEIGVTDGVGAVPRERLEKAVADKDYSSIPDVLAETARDAEEAFRDTDELRAVDRVVDAAVWRHQVEVAREHGNRFLEEYFRAEIDLLNVKTFARVKEAGGEAVDLAPELLPEGTLERIFFEAQLGEPFESLARALEFGPYAGLAPVFREWSPERMFALELACDNELLKRVDPAKTVAYGIEPLVAYILERRIEIKLLRTAVVARADGLERGDIENRLRSIHA
jgi:V/A-type H+-transporting ATPase subunit C